MKSGKSRSVYGFSLSTCPLQPASRIIGPPGYSSPQTYPEPNPLSPPAERDWRPSIFLRKIIGPPGFEPGTPSTPRKWATRLMFWLTDLSRLRHNLLRTEQLSGTTSSQNILESTFSVQTQKICRVSSELVGDCRTSFKNVT